MIEDDDGLHLIRHSLAEYIRNNAHEYIDKVSLEEEDVKRFERYVAESRAGWQWCSEACRGRRALRPHSGVGTPGARTAQLKNLSA